MKNFLAQEKRVKRKIALMSKNYKHFIIPHAIKCLENKQSRAGDRWETAKFLENRTGSDANGPLCQGIYNTSTGIAVNIFLNLNRK